MTSFVFNEVVLYMSTTNKSTRWFWTMSLWIFWDDNGRCMPWCYTLEQPTMRVTLRCVLSLSTSGGCLIIPQ